MELYYSTQRGTLLFEGTVKYLALSVTNRDMLLYFSTNNKLKLKKFFSVFIEI